MQIRNYIKWIVITFQTLLFAGCNGTEDSPPISSVYKYIQFVSPSGTNILDSIGVTIPDSVGLQEIDPSLIKIEGKQELTGQSSIDINSYLLTLPSNADGIFKNKGTLLCLNLFDDYINGFKERPNHYKDSYEFNMQSPIIFGDDKVHTLKLYLDVSGINFDEYKCEYDGNDITDNRLYGRGGIEEIITIVCK